jgi:hypothetical protein
MEMLKFLKISLLITGITGVTISASDQDISHFKAKVDRQKRLQGILKELEDKQHEHKQGDKKPETKKFTFAAGVSRSAMKLKSTPNLEGHSVTEYAVFGYEFTKKISAEFVVVKSKMSIRSKDQSVRLRSFNDMASAIVDYKLFQWLSAEFSFTSGNGKNKIISESSANTLSISKNTSNNPKLALKAIIPLPKKFILLPEIGLGRTYTRNKSYVDNSKATQPKKDLKRDELFLSTKVAYPLGQNLMPYINVGYSRVLQYGASLKSRNSYKTGAGIILYSGLVNIDWTRSKSNAAVTSNSFSLTGTVKF